MQDYQRGRLQRLDYTDGTSAVRAIPPVFPPLVATPPLAGSALGRSLAARLAETEALLDKAEAGIARTTVPNREPLAAQVARALAAIDAGDTAALSAMEQAQTTGGGHAQQLTYERLLSEYERIADVLAGRAAPLDDDLARATRPIRPTGRR
jgi:hypothetical protein